MLRQIAKLHPSIALGMCGLGTGVLNTYLFAAPSEAFLWWLGIVFGVPVGLYLLCVGVNWLGIAGIIGAFGGSWAAALYLAILVYSDVAGFKDNFYLSMALSGAVGGFIVAAGFALALRWFRRWQPILIVSITGLVAAVIVTPLIDMYEFSLFVIWQSAVGIALGWRWQGDPRMVRKSLSE